LRRGCGDFIGSKIKRNQYRKPERNEGTKSSSKKNQSGEEGGRIFSESVEENPLKEDPMWAAAWTCSWRAGLKMWPLAGTPTQKRRQGFKPVAGGEDCWVYGASI
jgi:hypothetical protein